MGEIAPVMRTMERPRVPRNATKIRCLRKAVLPLFPRVPEWA